MGVNIDSFITVLDFGHIAGRLRGRTPSRCSATLLPNITPHIVQTKFKTKLAREHYHKSLKDILENCLKGTLFGHKVAEQTLQTVNFNITPLERSK